MRSVHRHHLHAGQDVQHAHPLPGAALGVPGDEQEQVAEAVLLARQPAVEAVAGRGNPARLSRGVAPVQPPPLEVRIQPLLPAPVEVLEDEGQGGDALVAVEQLAHPDIPRARWLEPELDGRLREPVGRGLGDGLEQGLEHVHVPRAPAERLGEREDEPIALALVGGADHREQGREEMVLGAARQVALQRGEDERPGLAGQPLQRVEGEAEEGALGPGGVGADEPEGQFLQRHLRAARGVPGLDDVRHQRFEGREVLGREDGHGHPRELGQGRLSDRVLLVLQAGEVGERLLQAPTGQAGAGHEQRERPGPVLGLAGEGGLLEGLARVLDDAQGLHGELQVSILLDLAQAELARGLGVSRGVGKDGEQGVGQHARRRALEGMGEERGTLGGGEGLQESGELERGVRQESREGEPLLLGEGRGLAQQAVGELLVEERLAEGRAGEEREELLRVAAHEPRQRVRHESRERVRRSELAHEDQHGLALEQGELGQRCAVGLEEARALTLRCVGEARAEEGQHLVRVAVHQRAPAMHRVAELPQQAADRLRVEGGQEEDGFLGTVAGEDDREEPGRERVPPGECHPLEDAAPDEGSQLREHPFEGRVVLEEVSGEGGGPSADEGGRVGEAAQQGGLVTRPSGQLERQAGLMGLARHEVGQELCQLGSASAVASQRGDPREACSVPQRVQLRLQCFARRYPHEPSLRRMRR